MHHLFTFLVEFQNRCTLFLSLFMRIYNIVTTWLNPIHFSTQGRYIHTSILTKKWNTNSKKRSMRIIPLQTSNWHGKHRLLYDSKKGYCTILSLSLPMFKFWVLEKSSKAPQPALCGYASALPQIRCFTTLENQNSSNIFLLSSITSSRPAIKPKRLYQASE